MMDLCTNPFCQISLQRFHHAMMQEEQMQSYLVEIQLGEYYKIKGSSVTYEKNVLSFKVYIEGESVSIKATLEAEKFDGTASYSDGTIPVKGVKKK